MNKHYHFIGIGGIGMGALAVLLLDKGFKVSGSDVRANQITDRLTEQGASIWIGHDAKHVKGVDYIIFSSAIGDDNPELVEAKKKQVPILQRARLLAQLMEGQIGITVAGAHGKTTTSSMIAHLLVEAGFHPTTAVGGIVQGSQTHARLGKGDYFVTEVDESDGSFLFFEPYYSIITNIDFEHVDYYKDWQSVLDVYSEFIDKTMRGGCILAFGDDQRLLKLIQDSKKTFRTYGFLAHNYVRATHMAFDHFESRFHCQVGEKDLGEIVLKVPGKHNVANALACISLGLSLSMNFDVIQKSLESYEGVQRRFQLIGHIDDVWVIDDYAHHPTEISAILETAQLFKQSLPGKEGRIISVVQPHRYTRVKGLMNEFAESMSDCQHLVITDIYAASEQPIEGITAESLCAKVRAKTNKPVDYCPEAELTDYLLKTIKPHDIVLTLGAGDITRIATNVVEALKEQSSVVEKT